MTRHHHPVAETETEARAENSPYTAPSLSPLLPSHESRRRIPLSHVNACRDLDPRQKRRHDSSDQHDTTPSRMSRRQARRRKRRREMKKRRLSRFYPTFRGCVDVLRLLLVLAIFVLTVFGAVFCTYMIFRWLMFLLYPKDINMSFSNAKIESGVNTWNESLAAILREGERAWYGHFDWDLYDHANEGARKRRRTRRQKKATKETVYYHPLENKEPDENVSKVSSLPFARTNYTSYGEYVMKWGCAVTVLLMDPRVPMMDEGDSVWFALESVAAFVTPSNLTCVLIQTSSCGVMKLMKGNKFNRKFIQNLDDQEQDQEEAERFAVGRIYARALPLFRQMIDRGNVRITFPNHRTYKFKSCGNFYSPSKAFMNVKYWRNEFLPNVDSDTILIIQDDAVICHSFDVTRWSNQYAYVGGVWIPKAGPMNPAPPEGICFGMETLWKTWTSHERRRRNKQQKLQGLMISMGMDVDDGNKQVFNIDFPDICNGVNGTAPVGNGGFSLRSRRWMIEAITTCPHYKWSGIKINDVRRGPCRVYNDVNEDLYFAIIFQGIDAPMPTAWEASLFAMEMMWPEESVEIYGDNGSFGLNGTMRRLWGNGQDVPSKQLFFRAVSSQDGSKSYTVPIGMHKVWWYHSNEILLGTDTTKLCPFLQYMFDPEDTKWKRPKGVFGTNWRIP